MSTALFNYHFASDENTTMPELRDRTSQRVTVLDNLRDETQADEGGQYDYDSEVGKMVTAVFEDGYETSVYEDELSDWA